MALPVTQSETTKPMSDAWDYKGRPADASKSGGWVSAAMILGVEACERLTTLGIAVNLVTYLTGVMHMSNSVSANTVTNFMGTSFMLCLLGGFLADSFLGRYLTVTIFTAVQAIGVMILTISTAIPSLRPPKCQTGSSTCIPATDIQLGVLNLALYTIALGTGGLKSSVSGLGSDQFDESNKEERSRMAKFFSWFFFFISIGSLCAVTILVYIQDSIGRPWGYGVCAGAIFVGLLILLSGTRRYRFKKLAGSPLTQFFTVFVAAWRKRTMVLPSDSLELFSVDDMAPDSETKKPKLPHTKEYRFLDRAAIKVTDVDTGITEINKWDMSTLTDVEEVKMVLRMVPIWATTIIFWTVYAQMTTFSVSQAITMDRYIGKTFQIPPASLTAFFVGTILVIVPVYDRFVIPIAGRLLKNPHGLTPLQRIAVGLVLSIFAMIAAALIEIKRLHVAQENGLVNDPNTQVPLTVFWMIPQFVFVGMAEAFTYIGQLDFFLKECPKGMKTMSTGLFLSTISLGFFASSVLVAIVNKLTIKSPWLANNLNQGRLYNFYWLLAILSALNFMVYLVFARGYIYKEKRFAEEGYECDEEEPTCHA
ncbi:hypothetical protein Droror1_Dr00000093 [Drosera rotundifolia]